MKKILGVLAIVFASFALIACSPKTANVTLNVNGGDALAQTEYVATVGEVLELPTPTKTGYDFSGWTFEDTAEAFTSGSEWTKEAEEGQGFTLVAQWTAKSINVTLDANGGTVSNNTYVISYNAYPNNIPVPTKTGYKFMGWYDGANKIDGLTAWTKLEATTLVARWEGKIVSYVFGALDGATVDVSGGDVVFGSAVGTMPQAVKTGYNFMGWLCNGEPVGATWDVWSEDVVTLTPSFTAKTYTITLDAGDGSIDPNTYTATYDDEFDIPDATPSGTKVFSGWTLNGEPFTAEGTSWNLDADNITLVATYNETKYRLTFRQEGFTDKVIATDIGSAVDATLIPVPAEVDGYTFNWTINGVDADNNAIAALTEDTLIVAKATPVTYKVNFNGNGGTPSVEYMNIAYGANDALATASKVGYRLLGWSLKEDGTAQDI